MQLRGSTIMEWKERIKANLLPIPLNQANEVKFAEGEIQVNLSLSDWDRLGCFLTRLEMKPQAGSRLNLNPAKIEEKITYLGERLKAIEIEAGGGKAVLRSAPPEGDGRVLSFFEIALDPKEGLSLMRYAYDRKQGERFLVSAPLTRATLERLLADLIQLARAN